MARLNGIWGLPYVDLSPFVDTSDFGEIDEEIGYELSGMETTYTGGSLQSMGVAAPWVVGDEYRDLGHVIATLDDAALARLLRLADPPLEMSLSQARRCKFGDETDHPLSRRQMLYLEQRHGVYFPWKVMVDLLPNRRWEDKHSGEGKDFTDQAKRALPRLLRFIRRLPMTQVGRCTLFGLQPNDHATLHRDTEPEPGREACHCINFSPRGNKRFYLTDDEGGSYTEVAAKIFWFNDMDYHGVEAAPCFRYSIRVDGVFEPSFLERLRRDIESARRSYGRS